MTRLKRAKAAAFFFILLGISSLQVSPDSRIEIYSVRTFTHPTHTRIVIDLGKVREYSPHELRDPDRIYVDLLQTKLNPILHNKTIHVKEDYLSQIRIAQRNPTTVRVVADVDFTKIKLFRIWHLPDPFRVIIDIYPHKPNSIEGSEKIPQAAEPAKEGYSMVRQLGLGIQRIIIDPGHGGKDPGAIGKKGAKEKDIVLDVCLRLKKLFEPHNDIQAILTRETDIYVPVENRTVIANQKQADIFISVHANAFPSRRRSGVETFFLNFSSDPSVMAIAASENATSTKSISDMKTIIDRITKFSKIVESRDLAEKIQKNLVRSLSKENKNVTNLGTKGGPFWVLIGGDSPSVLVEISHLSNLTEEQRLKKALYRQHVARGIYEGIMEYIHSLGKV
jgi:N-acetylmuramoyl-L-alanine amidase